MMKKKNRRNKYEVNECNSYSDDDDDDSVIAAGKTCAVVIQLKRYIFCLFECLSINKQIKRVNEEWKKERKNIRTNRMKTIFTHIHTHS